MNDIPAADRDSKAKDCPLTITDSTTEIEAAPAHEQTEVLDDAQSAVVADDGEWEEVEEESEDSTTSVTGPKVRVRRRRRVLRIDAEELRLLGRRALCRSIPEIAPNMLKTVKLRILGNFLDSTRGMEDEELTDVLKNRADKLAERSRIVAALTTPDPEYDRGQLRGLLLTVLLQEETYSLDENRLDEKTVEFEKELVKRAKSLDLADLKKRDPDRWHHFDTYRIVLEAAWLNDSISVDEANLLRVLRTHLSISQEEHWLISAMIKRFPKEKCALHTPDEINEGRKELQRAGIFWSYRDETNRNIDVIPGEIAAIIRKEVTGQELQRTNYRRLLVHDSLTATELREALQSHALDRSGNKSELIDRLATSDIPPSRVLDTLDKDKLSSMCASLNLKSSGSKADLIDRLINFYDDLTFQERVTKDKRANGTATTSCSRAENTPSFGRRKSSPRTWISSRSSSRPRPICLRLASKPNVIAAIKTIGRTAAYISTTRNASFGTANRSRTQ